MNRQAAASAAASSGSTVSSSSSCTRHLIAPLPRPGLAPLSPATMGTDLVEAHGTVAVTVQPGEHQPLDDRQLRLAQDAVAVGVQTVEHIGGKIGRAHV